MPDENTNLYEELEDVITVDQTDEEVVLRAIKEKINWWNKKIRTPKYKTEAPKRRTRLLEFQERIKANPNVILQQAAAYSEIARQRRQEAEKAIRIEAGIFVKEGMISQKNLSQLAEKYHLSESEVLRLTGAKVKQKKVFKYKDDGVKEMSHDKMAKMDEQLVIIGKRDIYDYFGVDPTASMSELKKVFDMKYKANSDNINKTDPKVNAESALLKSCSLLVKDEKSRREYDKALENKGFAHVREQIEMLRQGDGKYIDPKQYKRFLDECTQNGIKRDKAEYLIYTTAEKAGLDVDEGSAQEMVTCRYCGALNERDKQLCKNCGMPLKVVCPKCGRRSADGDYRCTACGFSLIDMRKARELVDLARVSLQGNSLKDAEKQLEEANEFWPNYSDIDPVYKELIQRRKSVEGIKIKAQELCRKKQYYAARQYTLQLSAGDNLRKEAENAIADAEVLLKKADATADNNVRIDYYAKALAACADCKAAESKLQVTLPIAPAILTVAVAGSNIRLSWQKSESALISYLIIRKENSRPSGISDGENLGATKNSIFDDSTAIAGISYYYAVYATYNNQVSTKPALSQTPVMRVEELDPKNIKVNTQERSISFAFVFTGGLYAVEIYRDDRLVKTLTGSSFIDNGLITRKTYNYRFVAVYKDSSGLTHKTNGITLQFTPMPNPQAVDLELRDGEKQAVISWHRPSVGTLCIYYSDQAFKYNKNDVITIDTFKAERLNVTGETCTVNKDFSGERFYLPVTIQGNIGVAGRGVRIMSLSALSGVTFDKDDSSIDVSWRWDSVSMVRICYTIDGGRTLTNDVSRGQDRTTFRISVPKTAKSAKVKIASLVIASGRELLGPPIVKTFSMKAARVSFEEVNNKKKFGFIATDEYSIVINSDSLLPCDLHLLVKEQYPPTDLIHYTPKVVIRQSQIRPGVDLEFSFTYTRRNKKNSVHFRLIAADRSMAKQVIITPETRMIK